MTLESMGPMWRKIASGMMSDLTVQTCLRVARGTAFLKTRPLSWIELGSHMAISVLTMSITTARVSIGLLRFLTITTRPMTWRRRARRCAATKGINERFEQPEMATDLLESDLK